MKFILRDQKGTKRFVFLQKRDGSTVSCPDVAIPLALFVTVFVFIWVSAVPPKFWQFLFLIGLLVVTALYGVASNFPWDPAQSTVKKK